MPEDMQINDLSPEQQNAIRINLEGLDQMMVANQATLGIGLGFSVVIFSTLYAAAEWIAKTNGQDVASDFKRSCDHAWDAALEQLAMEGRAHPHA